MADFTESDLLALLKPPAVGQEWMTIAGSPWQLALIVAAPDLARQLLDSLQTINGLREGLRQVAEQDYPSDAGSGETWAREVLARPESVRWETEDAGLTAVAAESSPPEPPISTPQGECGQRAAYPFTHVKCHLVGPHTWHRWDLKSANEASRVEPHNEGSDRG